MSHLTINESRFLKNLADLSRIGATADGGVNRPAFSDDDLACRHWFEEKAAAAGLTVLTDGAGNQTALWQPRETSRPKILVGSHLDSVPNGGRFDGALGVLAALEAVQTIKDSEMAIPFDLEVVNFTDEEGTILGELGSQAFIGSLTSHKLQQPRGGREPLLRGLERLGLSEESCLGCCRNPQDYGAFVELHIEQGSRLEKAGVDIGVVTGIVGIRSYWLTFTGEAAHAGTMPMAARRDALWGATDFVAAARQLANGRFYPGVVNCGLIEVQPAAFNIVPAEVRLALEFRHGSETELDQFESALMALANQTAAGYGLQVAITAADRIQAAPSSLLVVSAIEEAAERLGLSHKRLLSFAGHDTQAISPYIPSAMVFVPSVNGISHNPKELTHAQDCVNGANVVLHTLLTLTNRLSG